MEKKKRTTIFLNFTPDIFKTLLYHGSSKFWPPWKPVTHSTDSVRILGGASSKVRITLPSDSCSGIVFFCAVFPRNFWYCVSHHSRCLNNVGTAAAKSLQSCPTLCDPTDSSPTRLPCPWDSPGKNTGVGCHFLLQRMKVKSESEVAQSCPTLSNPMDCGLPGSSVHGIFQARVLEWGAIAFSDVGTVHVFSDH